MATKKKAPAKKVAVKKAPAKAKATAKPKAPPKGVWERSKDVQAELRKLRDDAYFDGEHGLADAVKRARQELEGVSVHAAS